MKFEVQKHVGRPKGYQVGRHYIDHILVLDFETEMTKIEGKSHSYMTKWDLHEEAAHCGHSLQELIAMLDRFNEELEDNYAVVFARNLSHLFQYLNGVRKFDKSDVFAMDEHKILNCTMGHIEFRCLTLHSNMKMEEYTDKYGEGILYSEEDSLENRCGAMRNALIHEMHHSGEKADDLYSLPGTATGYVRRDLERTLKSYYMRFPAAHDKLELDKDTYVMLRKALRGGNCVVNRFRTGTIIKNVNSYDRCSAYTDSILNHAYPIGKFFHYGPCKLSYYERLRKRNKAIVMRVEFDNIRLKDEYNPAPYIDISDCEYAEIEEENRRLLSSDSIKMVITDVDFEIIKAQYDFDCVKILDLSHSHYGPLPEMLMEVQRKYYSDKTVLKGVENKKVQYIKSKAMNNSVAGILQQIPVRDTWHMEDGKMVRSEGDLERDLAAANRKAYVSFAWGVWTTAWARYELQKGIDLAGDHFLYADTDSVKYVGELDWSAINKEKMAESRKSKGVAKDIKGKNHYVGVWEKEKSAKRFCMLGQKKYACCYGNSDDVVITVSGLDKEEGSKIINQGDEYGAGIERFCLAEDINFEFTGASGNLIFYNRVEKEKIDDAGHIVTSNIVAKPAIFTLGGYETDIQTFMKYGQLNWLSA